MHLSSPYGLYYGTTTSYGGTTVPSYGTPVSSYGTPVSSYGTPVPSYGTTTASYDDHRKGPARQAYEHQPPPINTPSFMIDVDQTFHTPKKHTHVHYSRHAPRSLIQSPPQSSPQPSSIKSPVYADHSTSLSPRCPLPEPSKMFARSSPSSHYSSSPRCPLPEPPKMLTRLSPSSHHSSSPRCQLPEPIGILSGHSLSLKCVLPEPSRTVSRLSPKCSLPEPPTHATSVSVARGHYLGSSQSVFISPAHRHSSSSMQCSPPISPILAPTPVTRVAQPWENHASTPYGTSHHLVHDLAYGLSQSHGVMHVSNVRNSITGKLYSESGLHSPTSSKSDPSNFIQVENGGEWNSSTTYDWSGCCIMTVAPADNGTPFMH